MITGFLGGVGSRGVDGWMGEGVKGWVFFEVTSKLDCNRGDRGEAAMVKLGKLFRGLASAEAIDWSADASEKVFKLAD